MPEEHFRQIETNGITLRANVQGEGPLVVLVHGWPESWYSWRNQIGPLLEAGFRTCAIDVRGYGGSDCPQPIEAYRMAVIAADVAGVIEALGEEQAVLVGHDWGAAIVWNTALLHPKSVRAVCGMSVPYLGRGPMKPMEMWKKVYGDRFFYQLYFQEPGKAEAEFEADIAASLRKIYFSGSGDAAKAYKERGEKLDKQKGDDFLSGLIDPDPLPPWLSGEELAYYVAQFERAGFRGGLNRYRCQDDDWEQMPELEELNVEMPALFVVGSRDPVLNFMPGVSLLDLMGPKFKDLRGKVIVDEAGHWVQQEKPEQVNAALLEFLAGLD